MSTREKINDLAEVQDDPLYFLEPSRYDEAIIGIAEGFGTPIYIDRRYAE